MFERNYRKRLEGDLAAWQGAGLLPGACAEAIRGALGPMPKGPGIATVVGVVGGLLIAAAFLAFIAANWTAIPRVMRFAVLLAGIASANVVGAVLARRGHALLADTAATVSAIIFGAAIALVGQMYHIAGDFAGGLMLWAIGAFVGAALTGSRGALAVGLGAACAWSEMRQIEMQIPVHFAFLVPVLAAAGLALAWRSSVARHLAVIALLAWWVINAATNTRFWSPGFDAVVALGCGTGFVMGLGLLLETTPAERLRELGATMTTYAGFLVFGVMALAISAGLSRSGSGTWLVALGATGLAMAVAAAGLSRRSYVVLACAALGLALGVLLVRTARTGPPWPGYGMALAGGVCAVIAGMLADERARIVAGWLGLAAVIVAITWTVPGTSMTRAAFLACAGGAAIGLAILLSRLLPREAA